MNVQKFIRFHRAVDPEFIEEAQRPRAKRSYIGYIGVMAACLCVAVVGIYLLRPGTGKADTGGDAARNTEEQSVAVTMTPNPIQSSSLVEIRNLGYKFDLPAGAKDETFTIINGTGAIPMAQATFSIGSSDYTYRALKTESFQDISGIYNTDEENVTWNAGDMQLQMCSGNYGNWVGWYVSEDQTQWCLSSEDDASDILQTASKLALDLGHDITTAPAGAEDVTVNAFNRDGAVVAETAYTFEGVRYVYRTSPSDFVLVDISDTDDGEFANTAEGKVAYCDAKLAYNEGGQGKILWFDIVPGLTYSLVMESDASPEALEEMANTIFVPAQGDS